MNRSFYQQITVRNNYLLLLKQTVRIHFSEMIYLEAHINYTSIHLRNGKTVTIAKTLKSLETILSPHQFLRCHRAFLINQNHLKHYDSDLGEVLLTNNHIVSTSRRKKGEFEGRMVEMVKY